MYCRICGKVGADTPCCIYCGTRNISGGTHRKSVVPLTEPLPELQKPPSMTSVPQKPKNTIAVVGLVLTCLVYFFIIGFILSIIGLVQSKKLEGAGKKASIAGIVIGAFYILSCIVGVSVGLIMQSIQNKNADYIKERAGYYYIQNIDYNGKSYKIGDVFEGEVLTKSSIELNINEDFWGSGGYSLSGDLIQESQWSSFSVDRGDNLFIFNTYGIPDANVEEIGTIKFDGLTVVVGESEKTISVNITLKRYTEEQMVNSAIENIVGTYRLESLIYGGNTYSVGDYLEVGDYDMLYLSTGTFELNLYYNSFSICNGSLQQYHYDNYSYGQFCFDKNGKNFVFNSPELTCRGEHNNGTITVYGVQVQLYNQTITADLILTKV